MIDEDNIIINIYSWHSLSHIIMYKNILKHWNKVILGYAFVFEINSVFYDN